MKQATEKEKEGMNATEWMDYYEACETELFNQPQLTIPKSIAESKWMKHLLSCDLSQFEFERFDEFLNK
ncbi:hypothetical protein OGZ33_01860 [Lactococcus lactis]|uniref:hypothetical protein n=1 Tax=Lactococcus lactis TaxID=1358 RepID=UPI002418709B|nr:hypothetical protein [Lactococcus lactis]MDG4962985.1 hypothetical protein [Lactococcus lactis]